MTKEKTAPRKRKIRKKISESYLRNAALYYLQRYPASVSRFLEVMTRKMKRSLAAHPDQDLAPYETFLRDTLVPELERTGLLNDALYARGLAASLQNRGLPRRAIAMRLSAKGVATEQEQLDTQNDLEAAKIFARRKRLGPFARTQRDPRRDLAALARAGFSYDIASKIVNVPPEDWE